MSSFKLEHVWRTLKDGWGARSSVSLQFPDCDILDKVASCYFLVDFLLRLSSGIGIWELGFLRVKFFQLLILVSWKVRAEVKELVLVKVELPSPQDW
jgi:hypothetical protein